MRLPFVHEDAVVRLENVSIYQPVVQFELLDRRMGIHDPGDVVPILPLAVGHRAEHGRLGFTGQGDRFPRLAQLIVRYAAVVAKVLRVHFPDDERVPGTAAFYHVPFGLVDLHGVLVPHHLRREDERRFG